MGDSETYTDGNERFEGVSEAKQHEFEITVIATKQGAIEASDRIAEACSKIQNLSDVKTVKSHTNAPNDFQKVEGEL